MNRISFGVYSMYNKYIINSQYILQAMTNVSVGIHKMCFLKVSTMMNSISRDRVSTLAYIMSPSLYTGEETLATAGELKSHSILASSHSSRLVYTRSAVN